MPHGHVIYISLSADMGFLVIADEGLPLMMYAA